MFFEEIEQLVLKNEPIPDKYDLDVLFCRELLVLLYTQYRSGNISRDAARAKKNELKALYNRSQDAHKLYKAMYAQYQENIRVAGELVREMGLRRSEGASDKELLDISIRIIARLLNEPEMERRYCEAGKNIND